jgi:hypothetical protein
MTLLCEIVRTLQLALLTATQFFAYENLFERLKTEAKRMIQVAQGRSHLQGRFGDGRPESAANVLW